MLRGDYYPGLPRRFFELIAESCRDLWRIFRPAPPPQLPGHPWLDTPVVWEFTTVGNVPYIARVKGQEWAVHLNDLAGQPRYTLTVDNESVAQFDDWPDAWRDPRSR